METQKTTRRNVIVTEYTLQELADLVYKISKYRLRKKLEKIKNKIGNRNGNFYETPQVKVIFELIPLPSDVDLV